MAPVSGMLLSGNALTSLAYGYGSGSAFGLSGKYFLRR